MLRPEETLARVGHAIGGVCPFAILPDVRVYLDTSLRRFESVYPACGSGNSAICLSLEELERAAQNVQAWADLSRLPVTE
jgi:prolyl-tRNA editing enzyme YbaK/EbsC (Cys-tRNA(Pro) deacylase)